MIQNHRDNAMAGVDISDQVTAHPSSSAPYPLANARNNPFHKKRDVRYHIINLRNIRMSAHSSKNKQMPLLAAWHKAPRDVGAE